MRCACGIEHGDCAALPKRGWQELCDSQGGFGLCVNCTCGSTFVARVIQDAALCDLCRRLVTGEAGADPKVLDLDAAGRSQILCSGCARRSGTGVHLVALSFKTWVETGDRGALNKWRAAWGIRRLSMSPRLFNRADTTEPPATKL